MTLEALAAVLVAAATLLGAITALWRETHKLHELVNSRMGELLALTRTASIAEGKLAGADPVGPSRPSPPTVTPTETT